MILFIVFVFILNYQSVPLIRIVSPYILIEMLTFCWVGILLPNNMANVTEDLSCIFKNIHGGKIIKMKKLFMDWFHYLLL